MPHFICIAEITSSAIAIKRKVKENFRTAVLLMLAYCNRGWLFLQVYYHASYQFLKVREGSFAAILQVRSSSMFLSILIIGMKMYGVRIPSKASTFIPHFFKIGHLVEIKLQTYTHSHIEHGFYNGPLSYMERKLS